MKLGRAIALYGSAAAVALCAVAVPSANGAAYTIDFEDQPAGTFLDDEYASRGIEISTNNNDGPDVATLINSDINLPWEEDLEYPWDGGNLEGVRLGNLLIVAENTIDENNDGLIDQPDDEKDGGTITIQFDTPLTSFGFDLIDLEIREDIPSARVEFRSNGTLLESIELYDLEDEDSDWYDPTVDLGNNKANRVGPFTAAEFGAQSFDEVRFVITPSGTAIDNLQVVEVPEPAMAAIVALGVPVAFGLRRRRVK